MSNSQIFRETVKKALFGGDRLPARFFLAQLEPQQEVVAWLLVGDELIDVTKRHCQASGLPFTVCIGFSRSRPTPRNLHSRAILRFCEKDGAGRVLSEIKLDFWEAFECGDFEFLLFRSTRSINNCLSPLRVWSHNIWHSYVVSRRKGKIRVPAAQWRAITAAFCCPRPVSLVSVADEDGQGNIFPLNVMGDLGENYFGFCLKHNHLPEAFVQRTGRVALSSIAMKQGPIAYALGPNHNRETINWRQLPFVTRPSHILKIPVPLFARRVRELQVERVLRLGYHTFFLSRVISDERLAHVPELCVAHGFYEDWRIRNLGINRLESAAEDLSVRSPISQEAIRALSQDYRHADEAYSLEIHMNNEG